MICTKCNKDYKTKFNLHRHQKLVHEKHQLKYMTHKKVDGKYSCEICSKTYTHSKKLKDHYNKKHTDDELQKQDIDKARGEHKGSG